MKAQSNESSQETLLAALARPQSDLHEADDIERIDTHISAVLLAGSYAYKFKKPLDLGFLDFTTLAARRHYCEEELRLNRRLAPDLYLDVVAICGAPDAPYLCPADAQGAIEYAVRMKRFAQQDLLDRMLARGELTRPQVDALARIIADFHAKAKRATATDPHGTPDVMAAWVRQNFAQLRALPMLAEERATLDRIEQWSMEAQVALAPWMTLRKDQGWVRECHGDLHLGNIVRVGGEIRVFDCIEFNAEMRWTDVAAEIAFLTMDFSARSHMELGARFLNAYLEIGGDYQAVRLLPFYQVYRALVRAKVTALRGQQMGLDAEQHQAVAEAFSAYLRLAEACTQRRQPYLIITHGFSGSGKTTLSQPLLERLGALRLRSDLERKRIHGLDGLARSASGPGAGLYGEAATQATYDELHRLARLLIDSGWPVIVDAAFLKKCQRERFRALAMETGTPFLLLDCRTELGELRRRVMEREALGTDASEATQAVLEMQLTDAEPLTADELCHVIGIDTRGNDVQNVIDRIEAGCVRNIGTSWRAAERNLVLEKPS